MLLFLAALFFAAILPLPAAVPLSTVPTPNQSSNPSNPSQQPTAVSIPLKTEITGWSPTGELGPASQFPPDSRDGLILDAGTRGMILYFGSNAPPQASVRYRYRLSGYEMDWTETQDNLAHYRRLPPGHFQFQVQARVENSAQNPAQNSTWSSMTSVSVIQRPFFYQTWYFYLLLVVLLVVLVSQLLGQRDQLLKGQMGIVLEERNRIASDCHDTLMAGFAAVSWQLEATSRLFNEAGAADTPAAASCELARSMVAHCQSEARRIIWDLRDSEQLTDVLSQALSHAIETHRLRQSVDTTFELIGEEIPIAPGAVHHLVCIGQEAVTNAIRHAEATSVRVILRYESDALSLQIRDNGRGFHVTEAATRTGHFGIPVMQERARKLGGSLRLNSSTQTGTEVSVTVAFQSIDRAAKQQHYVVPWIGL